VEPAVGIGPDRRAVAPVVELGTQRDEVLEPVVGEPIERREARVAATALPRGLLDEQDARPGLGGADSRAQARVPAAHDDQRTCAIIDIGAVVLRRACADAAAWSGSAGQLAVHVNVSAARLMKPDIVETGAPA
jgi:hypothetical protein